MKFEDLFQHTFNALRKKKEPKVRNEIDFMLPSMPMVEACRADEFDFFRPFIDSGDLTVDQMRHAAQRYHLGKTISGQSIFWMIDDMLQPLDAHIGGTWISNLLKAREPLLDCWRVTHGLFGLHLMMEDVRWMMEDVRWKKDDVRWKKDDVRWKKDDVRWKKEDAGPTPGSISIVEREETAVVMSELFPESIWMAYATTAHLVPELFAPLEGRVVTIYPRTDPTMSTYLFFLDYVDLVCKSYDIEIQVDRTLEDHATEDQKQRCIDVLDFIKEPLSDPNSAIIPPE